MAGKTYNVLFPIYEGFNTLDVGGPLDVLCNYALRDETGGGPFKVTIAALEYSVLGFEYLTAKPDCCIEQAIQRTGDGEFDVLIIPGAGQTGKTDPIGSILDPHLKDPSSPLPPIVRLIRTFMRTDNKDPDKPKWMVSICVGALIAGAAGVFEGRDATSHWGVLPSVDRNKVPPKQEEGKLQEYCKAYGYPAKGYLRKRWVDGGFYPAAEGMKKETRVLSSGGIACGLDACLWLVEQIEGKERALATAHMMDYQWGGAVVTPQ